MRLNVNGVEHVLDHPPLESLLHVLREDIGITSAKAGCLQGGCGACTVLVEGEPRRSCLTPLAAVEGKRITTVEGLGGDGALAPIQAAFYEQYAAQCGFCTSGFLLAAHALLERDRKASREEIVDVLAGHMCRCTGYVKIVEAVEAAARGEVETEKIFPESRSQEPEVLIPGSPA
jgi:aerobic-type carbon monoxide dehydrogenase small subunit (CoxS/CutS family)